MDQAHHCGGRVIPGLRCTLSQSERKVAELDHAGSDEQLWGGTSLENEFSEERSGDRPGPQRRGRGPELAQRARGRTRFHVVRSDNSGASENRRRGRSDAVHQEHTTMCTWAISARRTNHEAIVSYDAMRSGHPARTPALDRGTPDAEAGRSWPVRRRTEVGELFLTESCGCRRSEGLVLGCTVMDRSVGRRTVMGCRLTAGSWGDRFSRLTIGLLVVVTAGLVGACGTSARADPPTSSGTRAVAASCVGLTTRQEFKTARLVFDGTMLPGPTIPGGYPSVLSSPARVRVTRYLKGDGPRIVRVQTAATVNAHGVTENSEGILPVTGQHWRIYTDRSRQPLPTSDCNGSRALR